MTKTLLCFGDSNTHGTMPMGDLNALGRFSKAHRWTTLLTAALPDWEVIPEGHPGRTTLYDDPVEGAHRNGLRILPSILESHRPIDAVVLMVGTNDLKHRMNLNTFDIALSVEKLLREIRSSGCGPMGGAPEVLVVAPPKIVEIGCLAPIFEGGALKSQTLGFEIGAMAKRNGAPFLDLDKVVEVSPIDGIHYEAEANPKIAAAIAAAVRQHFS